MLNVSIPEGAMFYGKTRHRQVVHLDAELREKTTEVINRVHEMKKGMIIPEAQYEKKCKSCSLYDGCLPKLKYKKIDTYIKELFTINEEAP
jgi:CRISPR-associated exonuclease Cas4